MGKVQVVKRWEEDKYHSVIKQVIMSSGFKIEKETLFYLYARVESRGIKIGINVNWEEDCFDVFFSSLLDYKDVPAGLVDLRSFCRKGCDGLILDDALSGLLCSVARLTINHFKGGYEFVLEFIATGSGEIILREACEHQELMECIAVHHELPWYLVKED